MRYYNVEIFMHYKISGLTFCLKKLLTPPPDNYTGSADKITAFYKSWMFIPVYCSFTNNCTFY